MIERLHFGSDVRYSGLEASIHLARYQLARDFVKGRRVLDIACGEGYGSVWLKQWGAEAVDGVDVSLEAVDAACTNFAMPGVEFHAYDAQRVVELFPGRKFDLIISLETIEHLQDPRQYLLNLRSLLAENGILIISCPNDWWYYPSSEDRNPFHVRKYHFDEFKSMAVEVLGEANRWGIGTAMAGFVNLNLSTMACASPSDDQRLMMASTPCNNAYVVPCTATDMARPDNSSYFFGVWGTDRVESSVAVLPVPMDIFRDGMYGGQQVYVDETPEAPAAVVAEANRPITHDDIDAYELHLREARLRLAALATENRALKANMEKVRFAEREAGTAVAYWRSEWDQLLQKYESLREQAAMSAAALDTLAAENQQLKQAASCPPTGAAFNRLGRAATKIGKVLKRVR